MKLHKLNLFGGEKIIFMFFGVMLLAVLYCIRTSVSQFSLLFPDGIYRYAAIAFISGVICVWLLIRFKPTAAVFLLLAILPVGARLSEFFKLEIGDLVVTADVIAIWISVLISIRAHGLRRDKLSVCFGLFIALVVLSSIVNLDSYAPTIILCGIITQFLVYGLVVSVVKEMQDVKLIVTALGFIIVFCSIFAFAQPFISDNVEDYFINFYYRFSSVFYNPVIFANVITLLWPFILISEPFGPHRLPKLTFAVRAIGVAISLVALILTGSRGGMVVGGVQIIWLLSKFSVDGQANSRHIRYASYLMILAIFVIAYLNIDLFYAVFHRFFETDFSERGNSAYERMLGALGGLELGIRNPFFGVGLGNFQYTYAITHAAAAGEAALESAHDFIINLFAEVGLFGVILWLFIITKSFRRIHLAKEWLYANHGVGLHIIMECALFGFTAAQFLFYGEFLHKNVGLPMILYFVVLGLASSLYFMQKDRSIFG